MLRAFVTLRDLAERYTVEESMRRALEFYESPTPDITFSFNDVRMVTIPAQIASYGAMAREEDWNPRRLRILRRGRSQGRFHWLQSGAGARTPR